MNILWLAWKDAGHPQRGGAELMLDQLIRHQLADGHQVTLLTAGYTDAPAREEQAGLTIIRVGRSRYLHPLQALWYYVRHLRGQFDVVIETVNTAPYFSLWFRGRAKGLAFYHQLAREVWFFEAGPLLARLGYSLIEPAATWLLGRSRAPLVTVSESTKRDLARFGWRPERTRIISEGIELEPLPGLDVLPKFERPTILSLGAMRGMKRTLDQIEAFDLAKAKLPELQLKLAGDASGAYGRQVLARIQESPFAQDIEYVGRPDQQGKRELMQRAHVIVVTSVKEGWGLIVTEAASQGTPAVAYDVDGLRDSIRHNRTGVLTPETPAALARGLVELLSNPVRYEQLRHEAWQWSKQLTFDRSYQDFKGVLEEVLA